MICPDFTRRTKMPRTICRPRPQAIVLSLIALRSVEKNQASPRITAMPRIPVNRPMQAPSTSVQKNKNRSSLREGINQQDLCADHAANQFLLRDFRIAENESARDSRFRLVELPGGIVMDRHQRFTLLHAVANPLVKF